MALDLAQVRHLVAKARRTTETILKQKFVLFPPTVDKILLFQFCFSVLHDYNNAMFVI